MATPRTDQTAAPAELERTFEAFARGGRALGQVMLTATGQTPKSVVWTRNKARLYHYVPVVARPFPVPILLVYALINRPYVLDLMPGNSFVEHLVRQGFDVYLLDWGVPGDEDAELGFEHYVLDYLPAAIRRMLRDAHADAYTLFGYCMGGTMSAMYAALFPDAPLANLVLLTTPLDFTPEKVGRLGLWLNEQRLDPDRVVAAFGNVPAVLIDTISRMLRPHANYVGTYLTFWDRIAAGKPVDSWQAMQKWVNDGIPFPGAAFRQWVRDFYQRNLLVKGELRLRGRCVDLASIACPLLAIAAKRDHIVPPAQSEVISRLAGSPDQEYLLLDAGHVGLLTGSEARRLLWPRVCAWLEPRSR